MDYESMAHAMFDAYNEQGPNPWKTHDGRAVPRWQELNDQVRGKWEAAAWRAAELVGQALGEAAWDRLKKQIET